MLFRLFQLAVIGILFIGCSGGSGTKSFDPYDRLKVGDPPPTPIGKNIDIIPIMEKKRGHLGYACNIVNDEEMALALGITKEEILRTNATPQTADRNQTACFFKWDDPIVLNNGIFIQLLKNPIGEEYTDYITQLIEQKRIRGEREVGGEPILFEKLDWGDDGSYSVESGKYFWRLGDEVAFFLAFNTPHEAREQYQIATKIATQLTTNFISK